MSSFEHIALNILTFSSLSGLDAAVFMQIMIPTEQIVSAFQQSLLHSKITFSQGEKKKRQPHIHNQEKLTQSELAMCLVLLL